MHSLPVCSQALHVVFTPLLMHLTLLRRQRAQAMEDLIRGCSGRRAPESAKGLSGGFAAGFWCAAEAADRLLADEYGERAAVWGDAELSLATVGRAEGAFGSGARMEAR